eukprot:5543997-Pleurochrysis_carterae.AAC.1
MSYKWGRPVATLPVTNGTIRHTRRMTEILRINIYTDRGICSIYFFYRVSPHNRSDASDWQLCFTWFRLPRMLKNMTHMGLRAI